MASFCICVDMVAMVVPTKRPGVGVNSWERLIVIWGVLFPLKDLAIFANLGDGVHFCSMGLPEVLTLTV